MHSIKILTLRKIGKSILGLFIFSFGIYLAIVANIGLVPWDSLTMGISNLTNIRYGIINTLISILVLIIDLVMKEKIGVGTILDACLTGLFIDMFTYVLNIQYPSSILLGIVYMIIGLFIMAFGQYFYMSAGLSCGPRDTLLMAVGKKVPKIGIGYVDIIMKIILIIISLFVDGPIGIGTIVGMIGMGLVMQLVFKILKFEPRNIVHEDILDTLNCFKL